MKCVLIPGVGSLITLRAIRGSIRKVQRGVI